MELNLPLAFQKALAAQKSARVDEARQLYLAILQAQPTHPAANFNMGMLAVGIDKLQEALPFFKTAYEATPANAQFVWGYVVVLGKLGHVAAAKSVFRQAKYRGAKSDALDQLEQQLNELGNSQAEETAVESLKAAIKANPKAPDNHFNLARALNKAGDLIAAIESYRQAISIKPNYAEAHYMLALSLKGNGEITEAIKAYEAVLKINPDHANSYYNIGNILKDQGAIDAAIKSYKQAIKAKPDFAYAYINMGLALVGKGDLDASIESYKQAIQIKPDYAYAYLNMGVSLKNKGDLDAAIGSYKQAIKIKPDYAEAYSNMGNALKEKGDLDASIKSYKQAIKIKPDYAYAYLNMGVSLKDKGDLDAAIESYKQAIKIKPDFADAYLNMGVSLKDKGDLDAAIESYKQAIKIKPDYEEAYSNMGIALKEKGDLAAAIESYKQAIKIKPDYADAYLNMGVSLKDKGDLDAAIESYKQAIKIKPDYAEAHSNLSFVHKYMVGDKLLIQLESLYAQKGLTGDQKCHLCFALAKANEDIGEHNQAFTYLKEGNSIRKKLLDYNITQDEKLFSTLKKASKALHKTKLCINKKTSDITPIFILGMPRSGTTLVEQIISSHSQVKAAGELDYVRRLGYNLSIGTTDVTQSNLTAFRQAYLDALAKVSEGRSFVTDKMPHNFQFIGLICAAFPEAKIIHIRRDPRATCWSNFKHYFPAKGLGYSYDLCDLVKYYKLYGDLMRFWHQHLSNLIYDLDYDALTNNQEEETRFLIEHIGLDWDDACLSPENNKRVAKTASQQQVQKKVYRNSSQEWLKFDKFLDGEFDKLHSF